MQKDIYVHNRNKVIRVKDDCFVFNATVLVMRLYGNQALASNSLPV